MSKEDPTYAISAIIMLNMFHVLYQLELGEHVDIVQCINGIDRYVKAGFRCTLS